MLKDRLRQALIDQAKIGSPTTYRELAIRLALEPPNTIRRVAEALEVLLEEDVAADRPILSAMCVARRCAAFRSPAFSLPLRALGVFWAIPPARRRLRSTHASCSACFRSTGRCHVKRSLADFDARLSG